MLEIMCTIGLIFDIYLLNYLFKKEDKSNGNFLCYCEEPNKNKNKKIYNKDSKLQE